MMMIQVQAYDAKGAQTFRVLAVCHISSTCGSILSAGGFGLNVPLQAIVSPAAKR